MLTIQNKFFDRYGKTYLRLSYWQKTKIGRQTQMTTSAQTLNNPRIAGLSPVKTRQPEQTPSSSRRSRDNKAWLADLGGPNQGEALEDLRNFLLKGLRYTFTTSGNLREEDLEDYVQDALLRILAALETFRGESHFLTWAKKIAVRVTLTELRRQRWKDISLDEVIGDDLSEEAVARFLPKNNSANTEQLASQKILLEQFHKIITAELTEKQSRALLATYVYGIHLEETARQMGSNRNALYKLIYDARKRLKGRLERNGIPAQELLAYFEQIHYSK
jgi:RNA polymerase sigma-70 factor (ECF subfamily)